MTKNVAMKLTRSWPLIVALLLAAAWFVWLRPPALGGGTTLVVVSGSSMEPTYHSGDLVIARQTGDYRPGDPIVYEIPQGQPGDSSGARIVHRVIGGDQDRGLQTQGDNLERKDPWTPTEADVVGEVTLHVPNGGTWLLWILQPAVVGGLAGAIGTYVTLGWTGRRQDKDSPHGPTTPAAEATDDPELEPATAP